MEPNNDSFLVAELCRRQSEYRQAKRAASEHFLGVKQRTRRIVEARIHPELARNLVGVGVSAKQTGGRRYNAPAITFFVRRKLPRKSVREDALLPKEFAGLLCDVVQTGIIRASQGPLVPSNPVYPLCPGCQIGVEDSAGTLGGFVIDQSGRVCLMTNFHVVSPLGDDPIGRTVYQPAPGVPGSRPIATVTEVAPIAEFGRNIADVAIARLHDQRDSAYDTAIPEIGSISGTGTAMPSARVSKFGQESELQEGRLDSPDFDVVVKFKFFSATFAEAMVITPSSFGDPGDSGSFVVQSPDNTLVGLFFGDTATRSFAIPIQQIKTALPDLTYL